jgi:hypothetical protein
MENVPIPEASLSPRWPKCKVCIRSHEFPKVLLPDPTVVIFSPDRAAEMCDRGRSALAISGAGSGEGHKALADIIF